jgi:hypothetical protein
VNEQLVGEERLLSVEGRVEVGELVRVLVGEEVRVEIKVLSWCLVVVELMVNYC